jgi:phospholipase/carboxylesterase
MSGADLNIHTHRWIPAADPGSARTLLLLHGTGGDENDLLDLGRTLDPTANLLSPRGNVSENGMPRFFRRLREGVFDEADVIRRAGELSRWIAAARDAHGFDISKLTAVGFSNGANIAAAVLLLHPGSFPAAILLRAMVPLVPEKPPALAGTRVLLVTGRNDPIVPASNADQLASMLSTAGAKVDHQRLSTGHQLTPTDIELSKQWLAT